MRHKEIETFPTTYTKDYIWYKNVTKSEPYKAFDTYAMPPEEKSKFIDYKEIKEIPWEQQLEIVNRLYAHRMKTTYQISYCKEGDVQKQLMSADATKMTDTLLEQADELYSDKTDKTLLSVPTARRVCGYSRPTTYYTNRTEYQDSYGYIAYNTLKKLGKSRIAPRIKDCPSVYRGGEHNG